MILAQLEAKLGVGRETGSGELNFCCPFCKERKGSPDTKYHLYVNPRRMISNIKGWFYCHRCRAAGPMFKIISGDEGPQHEASKWDEFVSKLKNPKREVEQDVREVILPEDYHPVVKCTDAYNYLKNRGISDEVIEDYNIGFGTKSLREVPKDERRRYAGSGRIIFPDYDLEGNILYWVARTYKNHKVKYKNAPNSDARDKIYNLSRASFYDTVIITEGVMSAIAAGRNAVATYGKDVTPSQISILVASKFDKYIVALDGDALKCDPGTNKPARNRRNAEPQAVKLASALQSRKCNVWLVRLPYWDDPDSVDDFARYLREAVRFDLSVKAEVLFNAFS